MNVISNCFCFLFSKARVMGTVIWGCHDRASSQLLSLDFRYKIRFFSRIKDFFKIFFFPVNQNITNLHVLNATIGELDVSQAVFRRLVSMALTDGNIGKIVGEILNLV